MRTHRQDDARRDRDLVNRPAAPARATTPTPAPAAPADEPKPGKGKKTKRAAP